MTIFSDYGQAADPAADADHAAYEQFQVREDTALQDALAQYDAVEDHAASCERTVAAGRCTGCEAEAGELIPWTPRERLCWACTDLQLDLMAKAIGEMVTS